jgi:hypothetical protein
LYACVQQLLFNSLTHSFTCILHTRTHKYATHAFTSPPPLLLVVVAVVFRLALLCAGSNLFSLSRVCFVFVRVDVHEQETSGMFSTSAECGVCSRSGSGKLFVARDSGQDSRQEKLRPFSSFFLSCLLPFVLCSLSAILFLLLRFPLFLFLSFLAAASLLFPPFFSRHPSPFPSSSSSSSFSSSSFSCCSSPCFTFIVLVRSQCSAQSRSCPRLGGPSYESCIEHAMDSPTAACIQPRRYR